MPYAIVRLDVEAPDQHWAGSLEIQTVKHNYTDIKEAEKGRIAYLTLYPETPAKNVQVLEYRILDNTG